MVFAIIPCCDASDNWFVLLIRTVDTLPNVTSRVSGEASFPRTIRLAGLILNNISPQLVVDDSETCTDDDRHEFRRASWAHIDQCLEDGYS
jgi:hypothetical protein